MTHVASQQSDGDLRGNVRAVISSKAFELTLGAVILLNMMLLIKETDDTAAREATPRWVSVMNVFMLMAYTVELAAKLFVYRVQFFHDEWNIMDFVVVGSDIVLVFLDFIYSNMPKFAALRVFRLVRLARAFKAATMFEELAMLLRGFVGAFKAIFWGVILVLMVLTIYSILAVQLIHPLNEDVAKTGVYKDCKRCPEAFRSVFMSILTFFQTVVAGDSWGQVAVPIIQEYPYSAGPFFLAVLVSVSLAIMNLILAVIVDSAQAAKEGHKTAELKEQERIGQEAISEFRRQCEEMDSDGSGYLSKDELEQGLVDGGGFAVTVQAMGLDNEDVYLIFDSLYDETNKGVDYTEFLDHLNRIRDPSPRDLLLELARLQMRMAKSAKAAGQYVAKSLQPEQHQPTIERYANQPQAANSSNGIASHGMEVAAQPPALGNDCAVLEAVRKLHEHQDQAIKDVQAEIAQLSRSLSRPSKAHLTLADVKAAPSVDGLCVELNDIVPKERSSVRTAAPTGLEMKGPLVAAVADTSCHFRGTGNGTGNGASETFAARDIDLLANPSGSAGLARSTSGSTAMHLPDVEEGNVESQIDDQPQFALWPSWTMENPMLGFKHLTLKSLPEDDDEDDLDEASDDFVIETDAADARQHPVYISSPNSKCRLMWDLLGLCVLGYDLVIIPLMMCFPVSDSQAIVSMGWATLVFWTVDIILSFFVGFYDKKGHLVMELRPIAHNYLRTWFPLDVFVAGLDWLMVAFDGARGASGLMRIGKLFRALRILRTLRLLRLAKLKQMIAVAQDRVDSEYLAISLSVAKLMLLIVAINHYIACIWFRLGTLDGLEDTWARKYHFTTEEADLGWQYFSSLHWSLTQFTPASMSVQPTNTTERVFAVLVLLFAMIVFSSFVSSITAAMNQLRNLGAKNGSQLWLLRKYLREHRVPQDLYMRLIRYAAVTAEHLEKRVQQKDVLFLNLLSEPLHMELTAHLHSASLCVCPVFDRLARKGTELLYKLCSKAVKAKSLSGGDVLFHAHEEASHVYFVTRGMLWYSRFPRDVENGCRVAKDNWCAEPVLWVPWVHVGKLRAKSETDLVAMDAHQFRKLALLHPAYLSTFRQYGTVFVQRLNSMPSEELSDLPFPIAMAPWMSSGPFPSASNDL